MLEKRRKLYFISIMGCGASIISVATPVQEKQAEQKSVNTTMSTGPMNIVISCHTNQQNLSEQLRRSLTDERLPCYLITQATPVSLSARANLIRWCDVFLVIISRAYQKEFYCLETINYAKDMRKPIIAVLAEPNFQAYGALGAISAGAIGSFVATNAGVSPDLLSQLTNLIGTRANNKKKTNQNVVDPAQMSQNEENIPVNRGHNSTTILICTAESGRQVAQLIYEDLQSHNASVAMEDLSRPNAPCSIEQCSVFVPVLTPDFQASPLCRAAFDYARRGHKPVVPVIATKEWRPEDWLGLTIAGINFFRIFDRDNAYKQFYDSNRMTDLRVEIERSTQPIPSAAEREQIEMKALKSQIEECKQQLKTWPPPRKSRSTNPMADRQPVRVTLEEPNAKLRFVHIHHSITRMDMKAPPLLLDEYGLPKRQVIDCMISYQWDNQSLVRQVYEDMSIREVRTWFDIWGSMQGNTNEAMALGVESAKVLLVFLSKAYVKSPNCLMEFRYAVKRGKAFVILRTEPNIPLEPWMAKAIEGFPQYDVPHYESFTELINSVPKIDVIMQAVRKLAQAQPPDPIDDCSSELFELRGLLDDARDALSAQAGQSRYKKCTRCNQDFDEFTKGGCTKHRTYYVGGSIIEGRWVCCRQQASDSAGCEPCDHTEAKRVFTQDPSYGTWTWQPS